MELEELIKSIDIVEFLSQFVELEEKGDEWWGLSCFKDEKTAGVGILQLFSSEPLGLKQILKDFLKQ